MSPLCERYVTAEQLNGMEAFYPLHVRLCHQCFLVQLEQYVNPEEIFSEYAYFSSCSDSWLEHARTYVDRMTQRFSLGPDHLVIELASNDGYLLRWFAEQGVPVLGVEPAANIAAAAEKLGIPTVVDFFGTRLAREMAAAGKHADLVIGNNVLAQVPDLNDFVEGVTLILKPGGLVTMEFPHLERLMAENQFDTIYHEHFSYFSFTTVNAIFAAHGLTIFDVDELPTHGGSLRIYARPAAADSKPIREGVPALLRREQEAGVTSLEHYAAFAERVKETKRRLLEFLIRVKRQGKSVAGYGAPGKGNTLLNYCGIGRDFLDYTVDRNPYKQGRFLPGTHIPIYAPDLLRERRPDYVLILPWNLKEEIMAQMAHVRSWGGQFVVPIPEVKVYP
jgi:hypothetical protein